MGKNRRNFWNRKGWPLWLLAFTLSASLCAVIFFLATGKEAIVFARVDDMQKAWETYPHIVGTKLDSCNLCHTGSKWNLNVYGRDYKQQGHNLTAIKDWDSDSDGFTNIDEINALTFPGNASDTPPPEATPTPEPTAVPQPDLALTKYVDKVAPLPRETVKFTLTISNLGSGTATDIVVVDTIPAAILAPTWTHSASLDGIVARPGENFTWDLPDMVPGAEGTIIFRGQLDPDVLAGSTVVNKAMVSSSGEDSDEKNNEHEVFLFVGGHQLYLPITLQN